MAVSKKKSSVAKRAPAKKVVKKAAKKTTKKTAKKPARTTASKPESELDELKALRDEAAKELAELQKQREELEREKNLARLNQQLAQGQTPPVVGAPPPQPQQPPPAPTQEAERERIAREREAARLERRRRRQQQKAAHEGSNVSSLEDARAKRAQAPPAPPPPPAAPEGAKPVVNLTLPELQKWKMLSLAQRYQEELKRVQDPLRVKYARMLQEEAMQLAQKDQKCLEANKEQIAAVNELIQLLTPQMPEGYAVTQVLAEQGIVECHYNPERAGKPLNLPGAVKG